MKRESTEKPQSQTFSELFTHPHMATVLKNNTERMRELYPALSGFLLKNLDTGGIHPEYESKLKELMATLQYPKEVGQGPICHAKINRYLKCQDCEQVTGVSNTSLCEECFENGNHQGHRFLSAVSNQAFCDCGNSALMDARSFCKKHQEIDKKLQEQAEAEKEEHTMFITEMKLLFYLFLRMRKVKCNLMDTHRKVDIFGRCLIDQLKAFVTESYPSQVLVSRLFISTFSHAFPPILMDSIYSEWARLLYMLLHCSTYTQFTEQLSELLLSLYPVVELRQALVQDYLQLFRCQRFLFSASHPVHQIMFQFLSSGKQYLRTIRDTGLALVVGHKGKDLRTETNFLQTWQRMRVIYSSLSDLRQFPEIVTSTLDLVTVPQLLCYVDVQEQKHLKEQLICMEPKCFFLMVKFLKALKKVDKCQVYLGKIMRQCWSYINSNRRPGSICQIIEKVFGMACFMYLDYSTENLFDHSLQNIMELLGVKSQQVLRQCLNNMVTKFMLIARQENFNLRRHVFGKHDLYRMRMYTCADQVYLRVVLSLSYMVDENHQGCFSPFLGFIRLREQAYDDIIKIYQNEEFSKLEEACTYILFEICLAHNIVLFTVESYLSEVMLADHLGSQNYKSDTLKFLEFVAYWNDYLLNSHNLKESCQRFIQNQEIIKDFVLNHYPVVKERFRNGWRPKNEFCVSYNSHLVGPQKQEESLCMYKLKINSTRRCELSRYIFGKEMVNQMVKLTEKVVSSFLTVFKKNKERLTVQVTSTFLETQILLFLETKDPRISLLLDSIDSQKQFDWSSADHSHISHNMYVSNKPALDQSVDSKQEETRIEQPNPEQADRKKQKKQAMKEKIRLAQKLTLQVLKEVEEKCPEVQEEKVCIVCKQEIEGQYLYFMSYGRVSGLGIDKNDKPLFLMSTCGHVAHEKCIFSTAATGMEMKEKMLTKTMYSKCQLCSKEWNFIIPLLPSKYDQSIKIQWEQNLIDRIKTITSTQQSDPSKIVIRQECLKLDLLFNLQRVVTVRSSRFSQDYQRHLQPTVRQILKLYWPELYDFALNESNHNSQGVTFAQSEVLNSLILEISSSSLTTELQSLFIQQVRKTCENLLESILLSHTKYKLQPVSMDSFRLPQDLYDLNKQVGRCPECNKLTSALSICFFCGYKVCDRCGQAKVKHTAEHHHGTTVFVSVTEGAAQCVIGEQAQILSPLYRDYVGHHFQLRQKFPEKGQYLLSEEEVKSIWSHLIEDKSAYRAQTRFQRRQECNQM